MKRVDISPSRRQYPLEEQLLV